MLEEFFYTVAAVPDGEEALSAYIQYQKDHNKNFDIVLIDIRMPKLDGVSLSKEIKEINPLQNIIALSAYTDPEDLIELINLGVKKFISKPIQYEEISKVFMEIAMERSLQKSVNGEEKGFIFLEEDYIWDSRVKKFFYKKREIHCTKYEYMLIDYLGSKKGMVCSIENIIDYFDLQGIELSSKSIRNIIMKIRQKTYKNIIRNLYGLGYSLNKMQ
jgi:DNA-binding response OmpR family regulator